MWLQRSIAVLRRQKFQKIDFNINHDKDAAKNQPAISVLPFLSRQSQKMNTYPNAFLKATVVQQCKMSDVWGDNRGDNR